MMRQGHFRLLALASLLAIGCTGQAGDAEGLANSGASPNVTDPQVQDQNLIPQDPGDPGEPDEKPVEDPDPVKDPEGAVYKAGDKVATNASTNLRADSNDDLRGTIIRVVATGTELEVVEDGGTSDRFLRAKIGELPVFVPRASLNTKSITTSSLANSYVKRALGAVGFSYWWGHGRWTTAGTSVAKTGSCSGTCPNCTHTGSYGADCSGLVAKAWQIPSSNTDITVDAHPYSTANMIAASSKWTFIDRAKIVAGDAMAYNASGKGHTFIYRTGDGWGSFWSIEARGCAYGIVHNLRTAGSNYKTLRKK